MTYYRRREISKLESLLQWRRNVFLQAPDGEYVLVSATRHFVTLHYFSGSLRGDPARTERLPVPDGLFDGNGWNLAHLNQLIESRHIVTEEPFAALYCKPLRASIRNLTDIELRVFMTLATYADDQGVCFPGIRTLSDDTGLHSEDVCKAIDGLKSKAFIYYLRHNAVDPITRKIMPNVFGLTGAIMRLKSDSGIQTYMHEFLSGVSPSKVAQPDSKNQYQELEPKTNSSNHHHHPTPKNAPTREMQKPSDGGTAGAVLGKDQAKSQKPDLPPAQPQPAQSAKPEEPPGSAPPPDAGDLKAYAVPLAAVDAEAYANELAYRCDSLQLAKARQLVAIYGIEACSVAIGLLSKQPFGSVKNKPGWLIQKLRQGALVPADGHIPDPYTDGEFSDFIEH